MPRMKHLLACLTIFIAALCAGAERAGVPSVAVGGVFGVFTAGQRASFAVRGGGALMTVEKPIIVYKEPGVYTDEIYDIYGY